MSKIIKVSMDLEVTVHDFPQGDKMTEEERRQWIKVLLEKVLMIHKQGKHYARFGVSNIIGKTAVFVHVIKNGWAVGKSYNFSRIIEGNADREDYQKTVHYLNSLIEDEEEAE